MLIKSKSSYCNIFESITSIPGQNTVTRCSGWGRNTDYFDLSVITNIGN